MKKFYVGLFFSFLAIFCSNNLRGQCSPPTSATDPVEGEFGDNEWIAYVYNYSSGYNNSTFDFSDYRGYYVDPGYGTTGRSFDSSYHWNTNGSPDDNTDYIGCTVTDNYHNVVYKRKGFPAATDYVISIAGASGESGNDDAAKLFIDGVLVWSTTSCCAVSNNVWTGTLNSTTEVEFQWSENGGASYGRIRIDRIPPSEDTSFGIEEWRVGVYNGTDFNTYYGDYTHTGLSFDTEDLWLDNTAPSNAAGYDGIAVGNDNHSFVYRREGFDCGIYNIDLTRHDDGVEFIIDGETVYQSNSWDSNNGVPDIWEGYLDENSEIEIYLREQGGESRLAVDFTYLFGPSNTNEYIWTGSLSTNPLTDGNWCDEAPLNDGTASIYIVADAINYPTYGSTVSMNNVIIEDGAQVTLLPGTEANIYGDLTNNGIINSTETNFSFVGSNPQTFSGNGIDAENFTVNNSNGLTLALNTNEQVVVNRLLSVTTGTFTTTGQVLLACNFTDPDNRTAQIDDLTNGVISGLVTIEQCFPARRAFRLLTSSVTTSSSIKANWQENQNNTGTTFATDNLNANDGYGVHITGSQSGANGFDATPSGNPSLFLFDNVNQSWSSIANTDISTLTAGTPYRLMIRGSRAVNVNSNSASPTDTRLRATGSIAQGEVNQNSFNSTSGSYNFFANPYHAAINVNSLFANTGSSNINTNYYYVYDPTLGGEPIPGVSGGRGAFVTVDLSDGSNDDLSEANQYLQPMQAAFFRASTAGTTPNLQFTEAVKDVAQDQTETLRTANFNSSSIQIKLFNEVSYINNETASDGVKIKFSDNGDNAIEAKDAPKFGNLDENLGRSLESTILSIESRSNPIAGEILPLYISQYRRSDYVFEINVNNVNNVEVYLKDNYLEEFTLLNSGVNAVTFSVDENIEASTASDRFEIVFAENNLGAKDFNQNQLVVYPNPMKGNELQIRLGELYSEVDVVLFDMLGKQVYRSVQQPTQEVVSLTDLDLANGIYILKVQTAEGKLFTQKIVKE
ncbi:T9SS type A sorting domain-containing protein [Mesonia sp.]|uniref:T9SS type A sorting domain-containing protein n=1 Tax=Mesonia sp. TaxID=1960830 RepID=UPI00175051BB|nr:T9SS type A sorting domain-containing protein [Mesonia sp.]HIB36597.1 T9SS type A sorting domain-containing protein [Mesonia sp.]HIO27937.1 T9SS type A sorting domain-containing protein [Flavobacteriaceae bacterium]